MPPIPTQGHGTSLLFRDVRELSELLLSERDWAVAIAEFEVRRRRYYDVILGYDRWVSQNNYGVGEAADRAREGHGARSRMIRASAASPTSRDLDPMASWPTRPRAGIFR